MSYRHKALRLGAVVACCVAASSCVTTAEQQKRLEMMMPPAVTQVNYYAACYQPVSGLRATYQAKYQQTVNAVTAAGAERGARAGTHRPGQINLSGLIIGALVASLEADAIATKQLVDDTVQTARAARGCYDKEFANLMSRVRGKKIKRQEAEARLTEIEQGYQETAMMLGEVVTTANRRQADLNRELSQRGAQPTVTQASVQKPTKTITSTTQAAATPKDAETAVLADSSAELSTAQSSAKSEQVSAEQKYRETQNSKLALKNLD